MRPEPFIPEPLQADDRFVRDKNGGLIWHYCQNRTLYADTDRSQVVYHANYLRYFELGRASLMRDAAYTYLEIEKSGFIYPIIEIGVQYYTPLHYDDAMKIYTRPGLLERVRLQFDYVITGESSSQIVCKGFTRHCATNSSGTPVGIDEKTLQLWKVFPK